MSIVNPTYLREVADATQDAVSKNNIYILRRMVKRLEQLYDTEGDVRFISSSVNDIKKLQSAGMVREDIEAAINELFPDMEKDIKKAFDEAVVKIAKQTDEVTKTFLQSKKLQKELPKMTIDEFAKTAKKLNMTPKEVREIESAYRRTKQEVKNLTRTMPKSGYDDYISACDDAFWSMQSGVSRNQAISDAVDKLAENGVSCVEYNSGRKDTIDTAVSRAVRTGINQATGDVVLVRCAELGVDHVQVSQHLGARVTKREDYTNHSHWQGKVYHLDWSKKELKDYAADFGNNEMSELLGEIRDELGDTSAYPDFIEECGYGKMLGICGINCRHTFSPYFAGINTNTYTELDQKENEERFRQEQTQRKMENSIRSLKLRIDAQESLETCGEEAAEKAADLKRKLYDEIDRYNEYCEKYTLPNHAERLRLPKAKKAKIEKVLTAVNSGSSAKFKPKSLNGFLTTRQKRVTIKLEDIKADMNPEIALYTDSAQIIERFADIDIKESFTTMDFESQKAVANGIQYMQDAFGKEYTLPKVLKVSDLKDDGHSYFLSGLKYIELKRTLAPGDAFVTICHEMVHNIEKSFGDDFAENVLRKACKKLKIRWKSRAYEKIILNELGMSRYNNYKDDYSETLAYTIERSLYKESEFNRVVFETLKEAVSNEL